MITRLISGGQTGADRGGLDAAIELGFPHGGYCPRERKAEDGHIPAKYNLIELPSFNYTRRTIKNLEESDGTLVIAHMGAGKLSYGSQLTWDECINRGKPCLLQDFPPSPAGIDLLSDSISRWIRRENIEVLNVAGNRESISPGIQEYTRLLLIEVLKKQETANV